MRAIIVCWSYFCVTTFKKKKKGKKDIPAIYVELDLMLKLITVSWTSFRLKNSALLKSYDCFKELSRCFVHTSECLHLHNPFGLLLLATDAKERQHWVSRLQICTQHHTEAIGKVLYDWYFHGQKIISAGGRSSCKYNYPVV